MVVSWLRLYDMVKKIEMAWLGVVHILRNQLRGGGGGFPNDYASVILTQ